MNTPTPKNTAADREEAAEVLIRTAQLLARHIRAGRLDWAALTFEGPAKVDVRACAAPGFDASTMLQGPAKVGGMSNFASPDGMRGTVRLATDDPSSIQVPPVEPTRCGPCGGTGHDPSFDRGPCRQCRGAGMVLVPQ